MSVGTAQCFISPSWKRQQEALADSNCSILETQRPSASSDYGQLANWSGTARPAFLSPSSRSTGHLHRSNQLSEDHATVTMTKSASAQHFEGREQIKMPEIPSPPTNRSKRSLDGRHDYGVDGDATNRSRASTAIGTSRHIGRGIARSRGLDTAAANYLRTRVSGKSYAHSPKFAENRRTWQRIGYGEKGIVTDGSCHLYQATRNAVILCDGRRVSHFRKQLRRHLRRGRDVSTTREGCASCRAHSRAESMGARERICAAKRKGGTDSTGSATRGKQLISDSVKSKDLADDERVIAKTKQQLLYLQAQMESRGYLDRQRYWCRQGSAAERHHASAERRTSGRCSRGSSPWLRE